MFDENLEHNPHAKQRWIRMSLSVAACAYEFYQDPIMSDAEFDELALTVDTSIDTITDYLEWGTSEERIERCKKLDRFFRDHFHPDTGMWIHRHPELELVRGLYLWRKKNGFVYKPPNWLRRNERS